MIAKIIISNSDQYAQNKWGKNEGYLALDCKHEKGKVSVEAGRDNCTSIR